MGKAQVCCAVAIAKEVAITSGVVVPSSVKAVAKPGEALAMTWELVATNPGVCRRKKSNHEKHRDTQGSKKMYYDYVRCKDIRNW